MGQSDPLPLRYLNADDVAAAMPPVDERLRLAERTMVALADGSGELPAKIGIHPRPESSFAHAMPAHLRAGDGSGDRDLVGMKWIAGFPTNRAAGLRAIHGLVVLNDPMTGVPAALLDAGPITAERTAAVSGIAIERFGPGPDVLEPRVAILGAGVQGRSHVEVVGRVLPGCRLVVFDRHPDRAAALAEAADGTDGIAGAEAGKSAREAAAGADVVVTAASFASPEQRQSMTPDWLAPTALVVAVDYATYVGAEVARDAVLFVVDERAQFLANRVAGQFDAYPDPALTLGEAILNGRRRPASGRVLVTHLGVGLADLVFGAAILERAAERGLGSVLPR